MLWLKLKLLLFTFSLIFSVYGQDKYSGVYEGLIDYGCSSVDFCATQGRIAFDFSVTPPIVLFDGVFLDSVSLQGNSLFDSYTTDFSSYPNHLMGKFMKNGFFYNSRSYEDKFFKSFLHKTGNVQQARELINKHKKEKENFERFFQQVKSNYTNKECGCIARFVHFPFVLHGNSITNIDELVRSISRSAKYNPLRQDIDLTYHRFQDHDIFPGVLYSIHFGCDLQVKELNGEFKLIAYLCYG